MKGMPSARNGVPHIQAITLRQILGKERPRLRSAGLDRIVEGLGLLDRVEYMQTAAVGVELQAARTQGWDRGFGIVNLRVRRGLRAYAGIRVPFRVGIVPYIRQHDRLVHSSVHVHLCEAKSLWIKVEQTDDLRQRGIVRHRARRSEKVAV